ncbi:rhomboid-like protein, partial [Acrasis kona]
MMGLMSLGNFLEVKLGTTYILFCTILLMVINSIVNITLMLCLSLAEKFGLPITPTCSVGFSGILFSYIVMSSHYSPVSQSLFGIYSVSAKYYPWFLLLISQILLPGASFLGHLSGIISGYIMVLVVQNNKLTNIVLSVESFYPKLSVQSPIIMLLDVIMIVMSCYRQTVV